MSDKERPARPITDAVADSSGAAYVPVTFDSCSHVDGPFFHGTRTRFEIGDELTTGHPSNYHKGRISNHLYFAATLEPAIWGAELATKLTDSDNRGHVYIVEPTGPFEDDPNLTNKRFAGNVTRSYRTRHPLLIVDEVHEWEGHSQDEVHHMVEHIARLRDQGLDIIED